MEVRIIFRIFVVMVLTSCGTIGVTFMYWTTLNVDMFIKEKPQCPVRPPGLVGWIEVKKHNSTAVQAELQNLSRVYSMGQGGHYIPPCISHNRTAIVVPYRNRSKDLELFLVNLVPFLVKQQSEFSIFIIEPESNLTFNRALLMNIGFVEAMKLHNFTCFIFHDVDLMPMNDTNLYRCDMKHPRHFSTAISTFHYRLPYRTNAGGVLGISRSTYEAINGMSNLYFGWGGEDDDVYTRLVREGNTLLRYPSVVGRYYGVAHAHEKGNEPNPNRVAILHKTENRSLELDGLSTLKYRELQREYRALYTWILVDWDLEYYSNNIQQHLPFGLLCLGAPVASTGIANHHITRSGIELNDVDTQFVDVWL